MINQQAGRFVTFVFTAGALMLISGCSDSDNTSEPIDESIPTNGSDPDNGDVSMPSPTISMPSPTISEVPQIRVVPNVGAVYISEDDLSLYIRFTDEPGVIGCDSICEQTWPPLLTDVTTPGISDPFDVIERSDGTYQWTLDDYPLYLYNGDAAADETTGDGVDEQWALARPIPIDSADVLGEEGLVGTGSTLAEESGATRMDRTGHTLYFFANDTAGASTCTDGCAVNWPPLYADAGAVDRDRFSVITRAGTNRQWAYDGKPLYFYSGDTEPAQANGDGLGGLWSVAHP